jgi:hypothetical protein
MTRMTADPVKEIRADPPHQRNPCSKMLKPSLRDAFRAADDF